MPAMTDPFEALTSFQQALENGTVAVQRGELDPEIFVHVDRPNGNMRLSYVRIEGRTVTAFATFVACDLVEYRPCFQIGYAVPVAHRNQGRAIALVESAIAEMQHGFARAGHTPFYVEAVMGVKNVASQHVAAKTISADPVEGTDKLSGVPAYQYLRKVE